MSAEEFEKDIQPALQEAGVNLEMDCTDLTFMASSGLRVIQNTMKTIMKENGQFKIVNVSPAIYKVFQMTGFTKFITIEQTPPDAMTREEQLQRELDRLREDYQQLERHFDSMSEGYQESLLLYDRLEETNRSLDIARQKAEESSKMKSEFIRQISHEIRTPLNILSGFTQVLTTTGMELDDETKADVCRQILENTDRITGLVNKMLELSDANSQTVIERNDQVLAVQIAAEAADVCGIATAPHLNFDIHVSPEAETAKLTTNQASAVRALSLVLDNARKFTKPAEAHTRYDIPDDKKRATLRLEVKEMSLQFIVEDNGIGIPATEADRIFDEFVQLDSYYDGTGIGLTVARSLARRLGGDILLDTSYAPGACFVMTLPLECL